MTLLTDATPRLGGPRLPTTRYERMEHPRMSGRTGSHMPIDTDMHWDWRNPLNIIPAGLLLCIIIAVVGTLLTSL